MEVLDAIEKTYLERKGDPEFLSMIKSEAMFGLSEILPWIKKDISCLEVGAGSGTLSIMVAELGVMIDALEPGSGFENWDKFLTMVEEKRSENFRVLRSSIESFNSDKRYDLIFSINVFEHISDWRRSLKNVHNLLLPGGSAIILCPNYGFPYESHFRIPVIIDKTVTEKIFQHVISKYETQNNCSGLWGTLNFISANKVIKFCSQEGINVNFDRNIFNRMLHRVVNDGDFRKRQGILSKFVGLFLRLKLDRLLMLLPIRYQPYMMFRISR